MHPAQARGLAVLLGLMVLTGLVAAQGGAQGGAQGATQGPEQTWRGASAANWCRASPCARSTWR